MHYHLHTANDPMANKKFTLNIMTVIAMAEVVKSSIPTPNNGNNKNNAHSMDKRYNKTI